MLPQIFTHPRIKITSFYEKIIFIKPLYFLLQTVIKFPIILFSPLSQDIHPYTVKLPLIISKRTATILALINLLLIIHHHRHLLLVIA